MTELQRGKTKGRWDGKSKRKKMRKKRKLKRGNKGRKDWILRKDESKYETKHLQEKNIVKEYETERKCESEMKC